MRCHMNSTSLDYKNCKEGILAVLETQESQIVTVCPENMYRWQTLFVLFCVISGLLISGLFGILFLKCFLTPITKMRIFRKMTCAKLKMPTLFWKENDMLWLPYLNDLLDGADFIELNDKVIEKYGSTLLDIFVGSMHHNLVKVHYV